MKNESQSIDLDLLFRLRLIVARFGEMDRGRWWNTKDILGRYGQMAISRGLPRTQALARARIAFEVARARCNEIFNPPNSITLWNLPAELEDQFGEKWYTWLGENNDWQEFISQVDQEPSSDLLEIMHGRRLVDSRLAALVRKMRRSAEGRAVPLAGSHALNNDLMVLLAAAFSRGEQGNPAVPYVRREDVA